jgi:hypothetical protein
MHSYFAYIGCWLAANIVIVGAYSFIETRSADYLERHSWILFLRFLLALPGIIVASSDAILLTILLSPLFLTITVYELRHTLGVGLATTEGTPAFAAKVVSFVAGPSAREVVMGDLSESYQNTLRRFGGDELFARRQYYSDAFWTCAALLARHIRRVVRWLLLGWAIYMLRGRLGL